MYFKENGEGQQWLRNRSDERVVGKVNLMTGVLALIVLFGLIAVVCLLSVGEGWWAFGVGAAATLCFILALWDPAHILRRHSRPDGGPGKTESRE